MDIFIFYILELYFINFLEFKRVKTILNPFFILSIPYTFIVIICIIFNKYLNFVPFFFISLIPWCIGLAAFWIGGMITEILYKNVIIRDLKKKYSYISLHDTSVNKKIDIIDYIFIFAIVVLFISLRNSLSYDSFGSKELGQDIGSGGIIGRCSDIALVAFPFYFLTDKPKLFKYSLLTFLIIYLVGLGSKTWTSYAFLCTFLTYSLFRRKKINIKRGLIILFVLFSSFALYYILTVDSNDNLDLMYFILRHFYFYFTSGTLAFGEFCRLGTSLHLNETVHPIITLIYSWQGIEPGHHSNLWYTTDLVSGTQSNVFTFFGTLFMSNPLYMAVFYSIMSGVISYLTFSISRHHKTNIFAVIAYGYTLSVLAFSWFNFGFSFLRIWEIYAICIGLSLIRYYKGRKNEEKKYGFPIRISKQKIL